MDPVKNFSEAEMIEMLAELDKYASQTGDRQHEPSLPSLDDLAPLPSPPLSPSETERNLQQINLDRISGRSPQLEPHSNSGKCSPSLDSPVDLEEANAFLEFISRDDSAPLPSSSETERNLPQINLESNSVSGSPSAQSPQNLNEADTSPAIIHPQPEATQSSPLLADAETSSPPQDEPTAAPHDEVAALLEMNDAELYAALCEYLPSEEQIESNIRAEAIDNTFDAMATQSVSLPFPAPTDLLHPTEVGVSSLELSNINFAMPLPPTEMAGGSPQNVSGPPDIVDQEMLGTSDDGLDDPVALLMATVSFSEYIPEIEMTDIIHPLTENPALPQSQDASDRASPDKNRSAKNGKQSGGQKKKRKARTVLPPYYVRKSARRVDANRYIRRRAILLLPKLSSSTSFTGTAEKSPWVTTSIQALLPQSPTAPRGINEGATGETRVEHVNASHETDALGLGSSEEAQLPKLEQADEEWQAGVSNTSTCDRDAQYVKGSDLDASQDIQIPAERADEEWQTGVSNTSTNTSTCDRDVQYINNMKGSDLDASQDIQIPAERVYEEWQTGVSNTSMNTSTCERDVQYVNNMKGSDSDALQDIQIPAVEIGGGSTQMEKSSTCDASTQTDVLYVDKACQTESSELDVSQDSQTPTVDVREQPSTNTPSDLDVSQDSQTPTVNAGEQPSTITPTPVRVEEPRLTEESPSASQPHSTPEQATRDKLMLEIALKHRPGKVIQWHTEPAQEEEDRSNDDKESERTRDKPSGEYRSKLWRRIDQRCPLPLAQGLQYTGTHSHTETDADSEVAQRHDEPAQREADLSPSFDDGKKSLRILERRSRPHDEYMKNVWRSRPIDQIGPPLPLDKEPSTDESSTEEPAATEIQTMSDGAISITAGLTTEDRDDLKHERTLKVDASAQASWVPDISSPDPRDPAGVRTEKTKRGKFFKLSSCLRDLAWLLIFFAMLLTLLLFLRERRLWLAADEIDYLRGHGFYYSEFYEQPPLFPWHVWSAVDSGENYIWTN
ncbi:hypothetical protein V8E54_002077 [Elaphomyces granulatus]